MLHMSSASAPVQADVMGIANGDCMSPIRALSKKRYPQLRAVIATSPTGSSVLLLGGATDN
jgi:hypothetical protein